MCNVNSQINKNDSRSHLFYMYTCKMNIHVLKRCGVVHILCEHNINCVHQVFYVICVGILLIMIIITYLYIID